MTSTATPAKIVAAARRDLYLPGPIDTCVINGMQRFAHEAGAPYLLRQDGHPTASITEARQLAARDRNGWTYHDGLGGLQPGDFVDWARPSGIFHVSTVIELLRSGDRLSRVRSIGSGGPTHVINWQPAAGSEPGWNDASYFRGYWRAPLAHPAQLTTKPAPAPTGHRYLAARPGEGLLSVASRAKISWPAIRKLNPHIVGPKYAIRVGQQIRVK